MSWLYTIIFGGLIFSSQSGETKAPDLGLSNAEPVVVAPVGDETERFEKTYPLNRNGRVSVSNVNGSIVVEAWDRDEVKLEYTKTAPTKERLAEVEVRIDSSAERFDVETEYDNRWKFGDGGKWRGEKVSVEYRLMVPRTAFLNEIETVNGSVSVSNFTNFTKLSAVNGSVKATNLRGVANISTVNGEVAADFDSLEKGSKIALSTVNGKVNLVIPSDSNATINADSLNGSIWNDFGLRVRKGKYVGRDLSGRIGNGDVKIKLDSVNGGLSIGRKKDGRNLSPAVDLLPQKDDSNWDSDSEDSTSNVDKVQKDVDKALKASQKEMSKAMKNAQKDIADIQVDLADVTKASITAAADAAISAVKITNSVDVQVRLDEALARQREAMSRAASDAFFATGLPRVKSKTATFSVSGVPNIVVDAKGCSIRVRGWDKSEIQYRITQFSDLRNTAPIQAAVNKTDSRIEIKVENANYDARDGNFSDSNRRAVIEIFVPKRSRLKLNSNGEIRVEGVSGELDLTGVDESIDVRDSDGILRVANSDGRVRVIGFNGEITAQTTDGEINLEGAFSKLNASATDGSITLTLPETASADIESNCPDVTGDGIALVRVGQDKHRNVYRIGKGGNKYQIQSEGEIQIRGASVIGNSR